MSLLPVVGWTIWTVIVIMHIMTNDRIEQTNGSRIRHINSVGFPIKVTLLGKRPNRPKRIATSRWSFVVVMLVGLPQQNVNQPNAAVNTNPRNANVSKVRDSGWGKAKKSWGICTEAVWSWLLHINFEHLWQSCAPGVQWKFWEKD